MQSLITEITSLKLSRILALVIAAFIFFDLMPHPLLSPGLIQRTLSKTQQTFSKTTGSRFFRVY